LRAAKKDDDDARFQAFRDGFDFTMLMPTAISRRWPWITLARLIEETPLAIAAITAVIIRQIYLISISATRGFNYLISGLQGHDASNSLPF